MEIEVYTLHDFMAGNGCYEVGERCYEIKAGDCFLFRPGERITGRAHDKRPVTNFAAHFELVTAGAMADHPLHCQIHEISLMKIRPPCA